VAQCETSPGRKDAVVKMHLARYVVPTQCVLCIKFACGITLLAAVHIVQTAAAVVVELWFRAAGHDLAHVFDACVKLFRRAVEAPLTTSSLRIMRVPSRACHHFSRSFVPHVICVGCCG